MVTTGGGERNQAERQVRALAAGAFDLGWTLDLPACRCGGGEGDNESTSD